MGGRRGNGVSHWGILEMLKDDLYKYARQNELILLEDPFHASTGYEFQRKVSRSRYRCVGYILGPRESVFYLRDAANKHKTIDYRELLKFDKEELSYDLIIDVLERYLFSTD